MAATSAGSTSEVGSSGDPRPGRPAGGRGRSRCRRCRPAPTSTTSSAGQPSRPRTSASWSATAPSRPRPGASTSATSTASRPSRTRRAFWRKHRDLMLRDADGHPVVDEAWGEFLLDVRTRGQADGAGPDRRAAGCAAARRTATPRWSSTTSTPSPAATGCSRRRQALRYAALLVAPGAPARPGRGPEEPGRLRRHHDRLRLRGRRGVRPLRRVPARTSTTSATRC